jgi:hypothetical protein
MVSADGLSTPQLIIPAFAHGYTQSKFKSDSLPASRSFMVLRSTIATTHGPDISWISNWSSLILTTSRVIKPNVKVFLFAIHGCAILPCEACSAAIGAINKPLVVLILNDRVISLLPVNQFALVNCIFNFLKCHCIKIKVSCMCLAILARLNACCKFPIK